VESTGTETLLRTAVAHHQAGRLADAEPLYRRVLDRDPAQFDALRLLGVLRRQAGDIESSIVLLQKALAVRPLSAEAHLELGKSHFELKNMEQAENAFRRAIEIRPGFSEAHLSLGAVRGACWFIEESKAHFEEALKQCPGLPAARNNLSAIENQLSNLESMADFCRNRNGSGSGALTEGGSHRVDLNTREFFPHVSNRLRFTGSGVEVGVKDGTFSEHLLTHWKGHCLYSVDPWREFPEDEYNDSSNAPQSLHDERYRNTIKRLLPFAGRSVIWRLTSKEAAELIPDKSLDFCYLDGDHRYEAIRDDIQLWFPKVRTNGILAGHDYIPDGEYNFGVFGVQRAVNEFIAEKKLCWFLSNDQPFRSWFAIKE